MPEFSPHAHLRAGPDEKVRTQKEMRTAMKTACAGIFLSALLATSAAAFSQTEFHLQYGDHKNPFLGNSHETFVFTVQQAAAWKWGESFFFIDYLNDDDRDRFNFNDRDFYGEWYPTLSFGKLANRELRVGPIRDFALIAGVNLGGDANVVKYLPGLRAAWDLPGFLFLNTDLTAYIDANTGVAGGGAPQTDNSFMVDVSWALPFDVGNQSLAIVGHAEYLGALTDEFGETVKGSMLAQPQFTWDVGKALGAPHQLMVGIEYQLWLNKLGTDEDESAAQLLLVWRL